MTRIVPLSIAAIALTATLIVELGARRWTGAEAVAGATLGGSAQVEQVAEAGSPGLAIPALALVDALLVVGGALMVLGKASPGAVARAGGPTVAVAGLVVIVLALLAGFAALQKLTLMLGLLASPLLGQATYLALFGDFPRAAANTILGLLTLLHVGAGIALVVWSRAVLKAKGLVLLLLSALAAGAVVSFALGFLPRVLASVGDAMAALVVCALALVWGVVEVVTGSLATVRARASS